MPRLKSSSCAFFSKDLQTGLRPLSPLLLGFSSRFPELQIFWKVLLMCVSFSSLHSYCSLMKKKKTAQ